MKCITRSILSPIASLCRIKVPNLRPRVIVLSQPLAIWIDSKTLTLRFFHQHGSHYKERHDLGITDFPAKRGLLEESPDCRMLDQ
jgi:hypothetical protein